MRLEIILSVALGVWISILLLVVSLCRAAKRGDEVMDAAVASAIATGCDGHIARSPAFERPLRNLSLGQAASLLGVSPHTLLEWEARYGFPTSSSSEPLYSQSEVLVLRDRLEDGLSITAAVVHAREQAKRRRTMHAPRLFDHRDGGLAS
jgi:hypothetical protein